MPNWKKKYLMELKFESCWKTFSLLKWLVLTKEHSSVSKMLLNRWKSILEKRFRECLTVSRNALNGFSRRILPWKSWGLQWRTGWKILSRYWGNGITISKKMRWKYDSWLLLMHLRKKVWKEKFHYEGLSNAKECVVIKKIAVLSYSHRRLTLIWPTNRIQRLEIYYN